MVKQMKKALDWFFSAFDTHTKGMSMRKFGAFLTIIAIIYLSFKFASESNISELILVLGGFVCTLLGIVTYQQIKKGDTVISNEKPKEDQTSTDQV